MHYNNIVTNIRIAEENGDFGGYIEYMEEVNMSGGRVTSGVPTGRGYQHMALEQLVKAMISNRLRTAPEIDFLTFGGIQNRKGGFRPYDYDEVVKTVMEQMRGWRWEIRRDKIETQHGIRKPRDGDDMGKALANAVGFGVYSIIDRFLPAYRAFRDHVVGKNILVSVD